MNASRQRTSNRRAAMVLFGIAGGMVGLSFAAVPLYQWFCQVTGYGGTTQMAEERDLPTEVSERSIRITFDANISRDLTWRFNAEQAAMTMKAGEQKLAFYRAENTGDQPVTGTATFNVTPHKAGIYFAKVECFCFTEQTLQPGQSVNMPVQFFVDPEIFDDPNTRDVTDIVLSYTFHRTEPTEQQTSEVRRDGGCGESRGLSFHFRKTNRFWSASEEV